MQGNNGLLLKQEMTCIDLAYELHARVPAPSFMPPPLICPWCMHAPCVVVSLQPSISPIQEKRETGGQKGKMTNQSRARGANVALWHQGHCGGLVVCLVRQASPFSCSFQVEFYLTFSFSPCIQ